MDQGVSYEAIEGLKDQKAIKLVMDQGISKSRCDGSGSNDWSDGYCKRWIGEQVMDQGANYKSGSNKMSNRYY